MRALLGRILAAVSLAGPAGPAVAADSAHDFTFDSIDGEALPLSRFQGKLVLVVNTASQCGFTTQYAGLEALYTRYRAQGLVVLGVPSNDFGGQEPLSAEEIKSFCATQFDISFPMTQKYAVTGRQAHPFYRWAADRLGVIARPRWNFHKYLVGPDGQLVGWFSTVTGPTSERVTEAIERHLPR